jgi:hypothetical protein
MWVTKPFAADPTGNIGVRDQSNTYEDTAHATGYPIVATSYRARRLHLYMLYN